jgi:hypothetical protein
LPLKWGISSVYDRTKSSRDLLSELRKRIPHVWAESNPPGPANHHAPIVVQLTSQAMPMQQEFWFHVTHHGIHLSYLSKSQVLMTIVLSRI